jgi:hypothetical protein
MKIADELGSATVSPAPRPADDLNAARKESRKRRSKAWLRAAAALIALVAVGVSIHYLTLPGT